MLKDTKIEEYPKGGHILLNINFSTEVKEDVPSFRIFVSFNMPKGGNILLMSVERRQLIRRMFPPFEIKVQYFELRRMCPT